MVLISEKEESEVRRRREIQCPQGPEPLIIGRINGLSSSTNTSYTIDDRFRTPEWVRLMCTFYSFIFPSLENIRRSNLKAKIKPQIKPLTFGLVTWGVRQESHFSSFGEKLIHLRLENIGSFILTLISSYSEVRVG